MGKMKRVDAVDDIAPVIKAQFAKNLRLLRTRAGVSQEDFARAHGFDRTYISRLERELSVPTLEVVVRLACALGVAFESLTEGIEEAVRPTLRARVVADHCAQRSRKTTRPYTGPTPRKDLAYLNQLGEQAALVLTSKRYLGASRVHRWRCAQGHEVRSTTGNLRQRLEKGLTPCVRCSQLERAERLSGEEEQGAVEKAPAQRSSAQTYDSLGAARCDRYVL